MRKIAAIIFLLGTALISIAKSYQFDVKHPYNVQVVRVAQQGTKFYKVWSEASSVDKAIIGALQDAIAASLFTGIQGNENVGSVPPICGSFKVYENNRDYFDKFFKKGEFLQYVSNVNSQYPSGENNVRTSKGHRVSLYVQVQYDALRRKLEIDGIIKGINDYF